MVMDILRNRKRRKWIKHALHESLHAIRMREDVADPALVERVRATRAAVSRLWKEGRAEEAEQAAERLAEEALRLAPPRPYPKVRENLDILVVALAVAMAFRTYFLQPFKIPTGSMQPTLYGITTQPQEGRHWWDFPPLSLAAWLVTGERYVETKAPVAGPLQGRYRATESEDVCMIGSTPVRIRTGLPMRVKPGAWVEKGDVLASGRMKLGDHLFVNRVAYNFFPPKRGDIVVFDTDAIEFDKIRKNTYYIKRLVGLPGETVGIDPPYLIVDGERITTPQAFERQVEGDGYNGYVCAPGSLLDDPEKRIKLTEDEFLPFGDNTLSSLDGRYFGGVPREALVGPALFVYWPFTKRWGLVD